VCCRRVSRTWRMDQYTMEGALLGLAAAPLTSRASTAANRQEPNRNMGEEAFTPFAAIVNCEEGV
jgi:hypothetical protein